MIENMQRNIGETLTPELRMKKQRDEFEIAKLREELAKCSE
jgi:hypothetical protein